MNPLPADVIVETSLRPRAGMRLHRARSLAPADRGTVRGIPVTSPARTLLDLAALTPTGRLEAAVERCELLGLFDLRALEDVLARNRGHRAAGRLRRALALYREEPSFTRSPLERRFLKFIDEARLPRPATNVYVEGYELDAYWERERFAVELDGFAWHRSRAAFERDRRRQEDLKLAGVEMLRVTSRRLEEEPEALAERLATPARTPPLRMSADPSY
ncbi:MAG TPA: DUF559 domain-containing protein [Solirubrobacterales bacterium]|nr:DUF559 domain-containing protein [Solirubrobacterales bacterium]